MLLSIQMIHVSLVVIEVHIADVTVKRASSLSQVLLRDDVTLTDLFIQFQIMLPCLEVFSPLIW